MARGPRMAMSRPVVTGVVARIVLAVGAVFLLAESARADCNVNLEASLSTIALGEQVTLDWSDLGASANFWLEGCCLKSVQGGSGLPSPACGTMTSRKIKPTAVGNFGYGITCQWRHASTGKTCLATDYATIVVSPALPKPSVSLKAAPPIVVENDSVTLTWTASNATACTASCKGTGCTWSGAKNVTGGSEILPPVTASATYSLNCTGAGGSKTASTTTTVFSAPVNLGPNVNSAQDELMVTPNQASPNDSILFSRRVNDLGTLYVAYSDPAGTTWSGVSTLPSPLNAPNTHNAGITNGYPGRIILGGWRVPNAVTRTDLFESFWDGAKFSVPSAGSLTKVNSSSDDGGPFLTSNSTKLLFGSDRPGGLGSYDIWQATPQADKSWGSVSHFDAPVNSPYSDVFPFLSADGSTFFLSSTRGGDFDLYYLTWDGKKWINPTGFAPPIRTTSAEQSPAMTPDGKRFYFVSNRPGGRGGLDIYMSVKK